MVAKKSNPANEFMDAMQKTMQNSMKNMPGMNMPGMTMPSADMHATMEIYRKNMELLAESQRSTMEVIKSVTALHNEFTRQVLEDMRCHYQQMMDAKTLEERSQVNMTNMKHHMDHMMSYGREVTDLWTKACNNMGGRVQDHMKTSMKQAQDMAEKVTKKH